MLFRFPNSGGTSLRGAPVRVCHAAALINKRLSFAAPRASLPVRAAVFLSVPTPRCSYRAGECLLFLFMLLFYLFSPIQSTLPRTVPLPRGRRGSPQTRHSGSDKGGIEAANKAGSRHLQTIVSVSCTGKRYPTRLSAGFLFKELFPAKRARCRQSVSIAYRRQFSGNIHSVSPVDSSRYLPVPKTFSTINRAISHPPDSLEMYARFHTPLK